MNSETELKHSLFFFDSGRDVIESHALNDNVPLEYVNSYDYIKPSQIRWYENELKSLRNTYGEVKNSLYMHIPIPEYKQIFKLDENGDYLRDEKGELLREADKQLIKNENADILYGRAFETVGCSKHNSGLFESMKKNNAVAIFSGHDHVNDIAFRLENILLVYVQYASYNAYNLGNYEGIVSLPEKDWQQGVTFSTIKNEARDALNGIWGKTAWKEFLIFLTGGVMTFGLCFYEIIALFILNIVARTSEAEWATNINTITLFMFLHIIISIVRICISSGMKIGMNRYYLELAEKSATKAAHTAQGRRPG